MTIALKPSHLYFYTAFYNTDFVKAALCRYRDALQSRIKQLHRNVDLFIFLLVS